MKKFLLPVMLILFFQSLAAQERLQLKERLYWLGDDAPFAVLFENGASSSLLKGLQFVPERNKRVYSQTDIARALNSSGVRDFILTGKSVEAAFYRRKTSPVEVMETFVQRFPGYQIRPGAQADLPSDFVLIGIELADHEDSVAAELTLIDFTAREGRLLKVTVPAESAAAEKVNTPSGGPILVRRSNAYQAELVYEKDGLKITTPVTIRRELEKGTFLVENKTSGRIFKIRTSEQTLQESNP